jgi:hypothetical protein
MYYFRKKYKTGRKGVGGGAYQDVFKNIVCQLQPAIENEGSKSRICLEL